MCSADRKNRFLLQVSSYIYTHVRITRRHLSYLLFIYLFIYIYIYIYVCIYTLHFDARSEYSIKGINISTDTDRNKRIVRKIKEQNFSLLVFRNLFLPIQFETFWWFRKNYHRMHMIFSTPCEKSYLLLKLLVPPAVQE